LFPLLWLTLQITQNFLCKAKRFLCFVIAMTEKEVRGLRLAPINDEVQHCEGTHRNADAAEILFLHCTFQIAH
jgi:hypothetical protein